MNLSRPPRRPHLLLVALLAVLALGITACGDDDDAAADPGGSSSGASGDAAGGEVAPFTLRIGVVSPARSVGGVIGWAEKEGILLERLAPFGVEDIELIIFGTGPPLTAALENGDVDIISTGDVPSIAAAAAGLDSRLIQIAAVGSDSWLIGQPDGPTDVEGLVGLTVTAPPGTSPERFVRGLIEEAGLTEEIPVTNLATPDAVTALRGGQVDAIPVGGVQAARLVDEGYTVIAKARENGTLAGTSSIVAREGFLADHPGLAAAFNAAWTEAVEQIAADFDAYLEWLSDVEEEPVELLAPVTLLEQFPTEAFPAEGIELLEATAEFLVDSGVLDEPFDIDTWIYRD